MTKNNNKSAILEIVYSGLFLSLSIILIMFPIPIYSFISIDFSLSIILISTLYISFNKTFFIAVIAPIFSVFSYFPSDIIGILILMFIFIMSIFLFKQTTNLLFLVLNSLLVIFLLSIVNILLFYPFYFGGYKIIFANFFTSFGIIFAITFFSTSLRLFLNLLLFSFFIKKIAKNVRIK